MIENWEASVRKYERWKDDKGAKLKLSGDLKMAAFESRLPLELENHLVLNKKRLNTYEAQKEEIEGILDSRIGANIKEFQIKAKSGQPSGSETPMDVDALAKGRTKGGKDPKYEKKSPAEGKGQKNDMQCYNCGKLGHRAAECWFKRGSSTAATTTTKKAKARRTARKARPLGSLAKATLGRPSHPRASTASAKKGKKKQLEV